MPPIHNQPLDLGPLPDPTPPKPPMDRAEVCAALAKLIAGLQVPLSLGMPLGAATDPLRELLHECGPGWQNEVTVAQWLTRVLR